MDQISMFDDPQYMRIPKNIKSPIESRKKIMGDDFIQQRADFVAYVQTIQLAYNCSWIKARKMLFKYRDAGESILLKG